MRVFGIHFGVWVAENSLKCYNENLTSFKMFFCCISYLTTFHNCFLSFFWQRHSSKRLVQSKIVFDKRPVKIFQDKCSPTVVNNPTQKTQERCVQASPQHAEAEVQTEFSDLPKLRTDVHNDSGVGAGDMDQEAFDLMVRSKYKWNLSCISIVALYFLIFSRSLI